MCVIGDPAHAPSDLSTKQDCADLKLVREVKRSDSSSAHSSRPSSRSSGRFNMDERVVPGALSRPLTPENKIDNGNCDPTA